MNDMASMRKIWPLESAPLGGRAGAFDAVFCEPEDVASSAAAIEVCLRAGNRQVYQPQTPRKRDAFGRQLIWLRQGPDYEDCRQCHAEPEAAFVDQGQVAIGIEFLIFSGDLPKISVPPREPFFGWEFLIDLEFHYDTGGVRDQNR
jgi:hypothetical protein